MSDTDCWGIVGYGIQVKPQLIDPLKAVSLLNVCLSSDIEVENFILEWEEAREGHLENFVLALVEHHNLLWWGRTALAHDEDRFYIYFPPKYPWELNENYCGITVKEKAAALIIGLLAPYLADGITAEMLLEAIGDISDYGSDD
jgi:hypothetical protein